jgi:hypothetical protein
MAEADIGAAVAGDNMLSIENCDMGEGDVYGWIQDHVAEFLGALQFLNGEDRELLLGYYLVGKSQTSLAPLHHSTQTLTSIRIREAMKRMGSILTLGAPTTEVMAGVLHEAGLENVLAVPLSAIVALYAETRAYFLVAQRLKLHRQDIIRALKAATKQLQASGILRQEALGAYMHSLIEKADPQRQGSVSGRCGSRATRF